MEVRVLGPLEVVGAAGLVEVGGRRQRALLARLAVDANRVVSVEALLDELWAGRPLDGAREALQSQVSRLRRRLGGDSRLVARSPGYLLRLDGGELDASRFESLVAQARDAAQKGEMAVAAGRLAEAEGCWRGPVLAEFAEYPFAQTEGARLDQIRVAAIEERMAAELALGHHARVVTDLEGLVGLHPLRERLWAQLITAMYRCGRQADALRAYGRLRRILGEELGIEPSAELVGLEEAVLLQKPELDWPTPDVRDQPPGAVPVDGGTSKPPGNLPVALTSFIGRVEELSQLGRLLEGTRLLTVTGPGGMGKTRLALELAGRTSGFPDGVWLVELAALTDPDLVPQALASALGVPEQPDRTVTDTLLGTLRARQLLVVLDNCEHLVAPCAVLAQTLLEACPDLRLLATSREPLRLPGETVWALAPLGAPDAGKGSLTGLLGSDSARLLLERARAVRPQLDLDGANVEPIVDLCARLEGIPLAIELAASRASVLSFGQLLARLDGRLRICASSAPACLPRHRSVQATLDWSYDLLNAGERTLLRGLSVFTGGFTLDAAEQLWDGEADALQLLDLLGSLVDKSLVAVNHHHRQPRYRLLDVVRQYAADKLDQTEAEQRRERHRDLYLAWAEQAEPLAFGAEPAPALDRIEAEHDNFRAALAWSLDAAPGDDGGLRLAHALHMLWIRGHVREGRQWLEAFLTRGSSDRGLLSDVARRIGLLAYMSDDPGAASRFTDQAMKLARKGRDIPRLARATHDAAALAVDQGRVEEEQPLLEEALRLTREVGNRDFVSMSLSQIARAAFRHGRYREARRAADEALTTAPDNWLAATNALIILGQCEREQGNFMAARLHLERCLTIDEDVSDHGLAWDLVELGNLAWDQEDLPTARVRYDRALELSRTSGDKRLLAMALAGQAELAAADDLPAAIRAIEEAAALQANSYIDISVAASVRKRLGDIHAADGRIDGADVAYREGLALTDRAEMPWHQAGTLEGLAYVALARRRAKDAAQLLGAAAALRTSIGAPPPRTVLPPVNSRSDQAAALLDPSSFEACRRGGAGDVIAVVSRFTTGRA